ncbi:cytidine deaminase [Nostoc sp. 106C]|uniref:cytidine deaminase n=1 Tax=Nostoc sp. 106C TaxID=1932667 RepID=UPI000A3A7E07|nr:cytidine deaminase [Nostoc sp. 106C]OUL28510.1 cytidine deaminase [Nostoc sp. 106C]
MKCDRLSNEERNLLLQAAQEARKQAYVPYSNFRIGAAILTRKGNIFTGCNIENASYSLTICAERVAVSAAIAQEGSDNFTINAIAVVTDRKIFCSPCGACRQVILEFGEEAVVLFQGHEGVVVEMLICELLPYSFCFKKGIGN